MLTSRTIVDADLPVVHRAACRAVTAFVNDLSDADPDLSVVLDDYHLVDEFVPVAGRLPSPHSGLARPVDRGRAPVASPAAGDLESDD